MIGLDYLLTTKIGLICGLYNFEYDAFADLNSACQCLFPVLVLLILYSHASTNVSVMSETTEQYLPADETDDSCRLEFIEIVPLYRDTEGASTTGYDSADWSAEVKQENLPVVKQEPDDVCYTVQFLVMYGRPTSRRH